MSYDNEDEFEPLPDQGKNYGVAAGQEKGEAYVPTEDQRVPIHERWMNWSEQREWYMQDMLDALGAEYIGEAADQPFIKANRPKRSSTGASKPVHTKEAWEKLQ